jgi:hypothetical protein
MQTDAACASFTDEILVTKLVTNIFKEAANSSMPIDAGAFSKTHCNNSENPSAL